MSLNASATSFEEILGTVYPITFSCYYSLFEFYETGVLYASTFQSFSQIAYNMVHKLGVIYDSIYYVTIHHSKKSELVGEEETAAWWYKLGLYYGTVLYLAFYTPEDFQVYDPLDDDYGTNRDFDVEDIVHTVA